MAGKRLPGSTHWQNLAQYVNTELLPIPVAMEACVLVHNPPTRGMQELSISSGNYVFITEQS